MKTTITLIIGIILIIYIGKPSIQFNPFVFEMPNWKSSLGVVFLSISLVCFNLQSKEDAKKEFLELLKNEINKTEKTSKKTNK